MTTVARLLPRHWDGRRLLQFLAGLALIALAFAVPALLGPAAPPADDQVTIVTTVDTPLPPGLPITDLPAPAAGNAPAGLALDTESTGAETTGAESAGAETTGAESAGGASTQSVDATGSGSQDAAGFDKGLVQGKNGLPVQQRPYGRLICTEARAAATGGADPRSHSERGPPQA